MLGGTLLLLNNALFSGILKVGFVVGIQYFALQKLPRKRSLAMVSKLTKAQAGSEKPKMVTNCVHLSNDGRKLEASKAHPFSSP